MVVYSFVLISVSFLLRFSFRFVSFRFGFLFYFPSLLPFSFIFLVIFVLILIFVFVFALRDFPGRRCTGAGPIFDSALDADDPKSVPIGSLVFFNAGSDEEARETVENDPYNDAGLFDSIFVAR